VGTVSRFFKMIQAATKYADVRGRSSAAGPSILVPTVTGARDRLRDWYWREIKEGGLLDTYLRREKARMPGMVRFIGRLNAGFCQNNRSDLRRRFAVPGRLYHRWKLEDPDFWEDDENLRSLKRDNPELAIYIGARRVRGTRKAYP
jgi:hypothetical protein